MKLTALDEKETQGEICETPVCDDSEALEKSVNKH